MGGLIFQGDQIISYHVDNRKHNTESKPIMNIEQIIEASQVEDINDTITGQVDEDGTATLSINGDELSLDQFDALYRSMVAMWPVVKPLKDQRNQIKADLLKQEREEAKAAREAEKEQRKLEREAAREAREVEKEARRKEREEAKAAREAETAALQKEREETKDTKISAKTKSAKAKSAKTKSAKSTKPASKKSSRR